MAALRWSCAAGQGENHWGGFRGKNSGLSGTGAKAVDWFYLQRFTLEQVNCVNVAAAGRCFSLNAVKEQR